MLRVVLAGVIGFGLGLLVFFVRDRIAGTSTQPTSLDARRLALLTEENERLRQLVNRSDREKKLAASKVQREAVERQVEEIRGLKFLQPVDYNVLSRTEIKEVVSTKLSEVYSDEEFAQVGAALSRLGLLPEGYPLRNSYIALLGEQIAAFYDQHTHKLYMFEDATLDNEQNRIVLAHELMHAMQDQHFGLKRLPLEIKTNDDRAIAASALVEGEATLVMSEFMMRNLSLRTLKDSMAATFTQNMDELQKAPRFLREMLVFPYLRGKEFSSALHARGGYEAIGAAYQRLPSSTAQILDPQKYFGPEREEPIAIEWAQTELKGQKPAVDNVVGEFAARVQLGEWLEDDLRGQRIASGWRGDRYLFFGAGENLVWKSVWRSEEAAEDFRQAQQQMLAKRYGAPAGAAADGAPVAMGQRSILLSRRGTEVLLVDGAAPEWTTAAAAQFR